MSEGKPGTGNTPLEKMFALVLGCWTLASIFPVILMYTSSSTRGLKAAILGPLFYHVIISINAFLYVEDFKVLNNELQSANMVGVIHASLGVVCMVVYSI